MVNAFSRVLKCKLKLGLGLGVKLKHTAQFKFKFKFKFLKFTCMMFIPVFPDSFVLPGQGESRVVLICLCRGSLFLLSDKARDLCPRRAGG